MIYKYSIYLIFFGLNNVWQFDCSKSPDLKAAVINTVILTVDQMTICDLCALLGTNLHILITHPAVPNGSVEHLIVIPAYCFEFYSPLHCFCSL